ncbi:MAG: TIGR00159 family protein [Burkholderiaceae bacterium]|nr:TIGR00159 family protein [Burkholderiaceae bacterium]
MLDSEHFRDVLAQFDVWSAIDILLIALVIFATLRVLSGTRGLTQLRGALALFLVFVVFGRLFDLTVVNFLVANSVTALVVGAVIILQPEIRQALDRLGRTGLQGWLTEGKYNELIESVVRAAGRMSAERHGGIFVLERETGLQDVIETGVPIDAKVSPELLGGIFYPNSPLHDMAVVLRDGRVVAASCVLPLANDPEDRQLGTRHRAAIGITEQTDALTVVVSEETGNISVALNGRLTGVPDERRLRAVLEWVLEPGVAGRNGRGAVPA